MAKLVQALNLDEDFRNQSAYSMSADELIEKFRVIVDDLGIKGINSIIQNGVKLYFGEWLSKRANLSVELIKGLEERVPELKFGAEDNIEREDIERSLSWIPEDTQEPFWSELAQRKLNQIIDQFRTIEDPSRLSECVTGVFSFLAKRTQKELFSSIFENETFVTTLKKVASVPGKLNPFYYCNDDKSRNLLLLHAYLKDVWIEGTEEQYLTLGSLGSDRWFLKTKFLVEAMKDENFIKKTLENPKAFGFKELVSTITHEIQRDSSIVSKIFPQTAPAMKLFLENAKDLPIGPTFCGAIGELSFDVAAQAMKDSRVCGSMETCREDFVYGVMEQFNKTEKLNQEFWDKLSLAIPFDFEAVNFYKIVGLHKYGKEFSEEIVFKRARLVQDFLESHGSSLGRSERFIGSITQNFNGGKVQPLLEEFEKAGIFKIDDFVLSKVLSEHEALIDEYIFALKKNPDILSQMVDGVPVWWSLGSKIRRGFFWEREVKDFKVYAEDGQSFPSFVMGRRFGSSRIGRPEAYAMIDSFLKGVDSKTYDFKLDHKDLKGRNILHHFLAEANNYPVKAERFMTTLKQMGLKKSVFKKMLNEKDVRGLTPFDYFMDLPSSGQVHKESFSFKILEGILKNIEFDEDYRNDHNFKLVSHLLDAVSEETSLQEKQKIEAQLILKVTHSDKPKQQTTRSPFKI